MGRLFDGLKERAVGEHTVYCVYSPVSVQRESLPASQIDVEELELVDIRVNAKDSESVKKFLDRVTREALEKEVRGFYLLAMVLDRNGEYHFSCEDPTVEELRERLKEKIEGLKEE